MKIVHLDNTGGYMHVAKGKGDNQRTSILPKPIIDALGAYLQRRVEGVIFEGREGAYLHEADLKAAGRDGREIRAPKNEAVRGETAEKDHAITAEA